MKQKIIQLSIGEVLGQTFDLQTIEMYNKLGISPTTDKGITVSVKVPYSAYCSGKKAKTFNAQAYESIDGHRSLFTFVKIHGYNTLEELKESPYTSIALWIRINHIHGQNVLIVTHGHGPDRGEAYYRAKDYNDFWNVVQRLSDMYNYPEKEHEPVILKQNNQMCGNSYREWDVVVK